MSFEVRGCILRLHLLDVLCGQIFLDNRQSWKWVRLRRKIPTISMCGLLYCHEMSSSLPPQGERPQVGTWWASGCPPQHRQGLYRSSQRLLLRVAHILSPGFKAVLIPLSGSIRLIDARELSQSLSWWCDHTQDISVAGSDPFGEKGKGIRFNRQQERKKPADGLNVS